MATMIHDPGEIRGFRVISFALLFLSLSGLLAAANASKSSGKLHVLFGDDFKNKKHQTLYFLESTDSGTRDGSDKPRHAPLDFEGNTPAGLKPGQILEITGHDKDGHGKISVQGCRVVSEPAAPALMATPSGTPGYTGPIATYTATPTCTHRVLAILLNFSDKNLACSPSDVDSLAFTSQQSVSNFYRENTFNGLGLQGTTIGPFTLPYSSASCDPYGFAGAADTAALGAGYDPNTYDHVMYILPEGSCTYGGLGELSAKRTWLYFCDWTEVYAHELGHNLGLHHASYGSQEYGDDSDVMGYSLHDFNGPHKAELEANVCFTMPPRILPVSDCGVYSLYALESPVDNNQIIRIAKPDTADYYWLSYRVPTGVDSGLSSTFAYKLSIHKWSGANWVQTFFIDSLSDGASYVDSANNITITQLSHNQIYAQLSISVGICATATPSSTVTPTQTPSSTATETATASATATRTPTPSPIVPTASVTPTPAPAEPTTEPEAPCPAQIDRIMITPNPQQAAADRMVSVKLGCPADEVDVQIYSESGTLLFSWSVTNVHVQRGQWVHLKYPHEVDLPNGTYVVKVNVISGSTSAQGSAVFVVLN